MVQMFPIPFISPVRMRQMWACLMMGVLFLSGPAGPWVEASTSSGHFWAERQSERFRRENRSILSAPSPSPVPLKEGYVTQSFRPFQDLDPHSQNGPVKIPLIVHLQETHGDVAAQKKMVELLRKVAQRDSPSGVTPAIQVAVEGAWGPIDTTWVRHLPDPAYRDDLARLFLQTGWMTGEEFLSATTSSPDLHLVGVEDPLLFQANGEVREKSAPARFVMAECMGAYTRLFSSLDPVVLPPAVLRLVKIKERFESGNLTLETYVKELDSAGPTPWDRKDFPSLTRLMEYNVLAHHPRLVSARLKLTKTAPRATVSSENTLTSQDMDQLTSFARASAVVNPDGVRQDLLRLEGRRLTEAMNRLPVANRITTTEFLQLKRWFHLNQQLWNLTMTPEEWESFRDLKQRMDWPSFHGALDRLCRARNIHPPEKYLGERIIRLAQESESLLEGYYQMAQGRDRAMTTRTVALARTAGNGFAVLITGGFHSPGVRRCLRWEPASYIEISPRFADQTFPHTLRDLTRFQLSPHRVSVPSLMEAFTRLHHPTLWAQMKKTAPFPLAFHRIIESGGTRHLAGLAPGTEKDIPFLLGGTPEVPELIEGREALARLRDSSVTTNPAMENPMKDALNILLSRHPWMFAVKSSIEKRTAWLTKIGGALMNALHDMASITSPSLFPLFRTPWLKWAFVGMGGPLYFLPPHNGSTQGNGPARGVGPSELINQALTFIRRGAFNDAEQTLRRLHAVDLDDHWSGELFRHLSSEERVRAGNKLSPRVWSAALNGHFTRLFEEHAAFLMNQYRETSEFLGAGGQRLPGMQDHLQKATTILSLFSMNAHSPHIPADAPHGGMVLKHNQEQTSTSGVERSWGWFCASLKNYVSKSTFDNEDAKALLKILRFERRWLADRLRCWLHPFLTGDPAGAQWVEDDFLLPSIYGEYRLIQPFFPDTGPNLRTCFEARRRCARERSLGVVTDLTTSPPHRLVDKNLGAHPALLAAVEHARVGLVNGTVRVEHPWPNTFAPFEQALADRLRQGLDPWGPRKLWRLNLGQLMRVSNGTTKLSTRLSDLLRSLGEAGGSAVILNLTEFDERLRSEPEALADAIQNLRRSERERGILGPERTLVFLTGLTGGRDPLASRGQNASPLINVEPSPELVLALLQSRAHRMKGNGLECDLEILSRLAHGIKEGLLDLPMADGILDRAGARARARAGGGTARVENGDVDLEQVGLPPFEHLSLWRQAGIALHAMSVDVGTELQQYLAELRRMPPRDPNYPPLMTFIRHLLALRFLWPQTSSTSEQDRRWDRTPQENSALLENWRAQRQSFRDALDQSITGQNDLKAELERTYLLHDFQQWGNPAPGPADMVLLEGPPGTGKTTIAQALAKASGRKFIEINAGGTTDPKRWKGLKRTFVGSQPSEITRQLEEAGTEDALILIDEVDKMSREALDALTDFLDKRQEYHDTYLGSRLRYLRPRVRVLLTANRIDEQVFPDHLLSRLRRVFTRLYTDKELMAIGLDHVFPETLRLTDFGKTRVSVPAPGDVIKTIVSDYLPGKDVRDLQKYLRRLFSQAYHEWLLSSSPGRPSAPVVVDSAFVRRVLGSPPVSVESIPGEDIVGQVNGLAAGAFNGIVTPVQAYFRPLPLEEGQELIVTGLMKSDMRDSAQRAVLSVQQALGETEGGGRIHFHIPGEFSKSGPSAGLAFVTALYSERTGWPVRAGVAMTGEISPTGKAQRIGMLDEKLSAAVRAGVNTVFIPSGNEPELREALARDDHLRGAVEEGDRARLFISDSALARLLSTGSPGASPLPNGLLLDGAVPGGRWLQGSRTDVASFLTDHPECSPIVTCVLVRHAFEVLNRTIVRPVGAPLLEIPVEPTQGAEWASPASHFDPQAPPRPLPPSDDKKPPAPLSPPAERASPFVDEIQRLSFGSTAEDRIASLQRLLATGRENDARQVMSVLHVLSSVADPSFVRTLGHLPQWKERLSVAARPADLQTLGVLFARARDAVAMNEMATLREGIKGAEPWLTGSPLNAGDNMRQARIRWTSQRQRAAKLRDELIGIETRVPEYRFFDHVAIFLEQIIEDVPADKTSPSFEENERFQSTVKNYLAFMNHQLGDYPGPTALPTRVLRAKELPLITPISDLVQENALLDWIATNEYRRPTAQVSMAALAAQGETALRRRWRIGEVIDHTGPGSVPLTGEEIAAFRPAAEELTRRLASADSRSVMFYSPSDSMSMRFLNAAADHFQRTSPFPDQRAVRVVSVTFPEIVGEAKPLTTFLQETISQTRAAGDVVLAIDLDAFSRHFKTDLATAMATLLDTASDPEGPFGAFPPAPLLFFGKEETHLAMTDASLPYDRTVQAYPLLPKQAGPYLAEWLIAQVIERLGLVVFDAAARKSLVELLDRENELDLPLVLSALLNATTAARSSGGSVITGTEVTRAMGEALAGAGKSPENIEEYRAAARRIPDPIARRRLMSEISRLARLGPGGDQQMLTTWIETVLSWPWREKPLPCVSPDDIPDLVRNAMNTLDLEVYGMRDIKQEIIRIYELYLHQVSQGREPDMPIIALSGPPGTAKTHLARLVGKIFDLPSEVIACSGVDDPRHFVGFFRTYTASEEGSIVKAYRKTKTKRMVLVFDELDKRRAEGHFGDPLNALTRFFDPKHRRFTDDFLELSLDVSQTLVIITLNRLNTIPEHLQSRMTVLKVEGPTREDKIGMAEKILLPRLMKSKGFSRENGRGLSPHWTPPVFVEDASSLLTQLVDHHLNPRDDARKIEERLNQLLDSAFGDYVETGRPVRLNADALERYLGPSQGPRETAIKAGQGEIGRMEIPVQEGARITAHAIYRPGLKWQLQLPLVLGDQEKRPNTLAETARLAWDLALSSVMLHQPNTPRGTVYLHLDPHDAALDQPGMGFAGLGLFAAVYSSMIGHAPPLGVSLGGAIDLKGNVLPINLKEHGTLARKVIRSSAEGNQTFYLPGGEGTRRQLESLMYQHPALRGLVVQNGTAELTLLSDPGVGDPSDTGPATRRREQEADLWNRFLEGLPTKARGMGVEVTQNKIPEASIETVTLRGTENAILHILEQEKEIASHLTSADPSGHPAISLPRYVLVEKVEEVLEALFSDKAGPTPPRTPVGGPPSSGVRSAPPASDQGSPPPQAGGESFSFSSDRPILAAVRILGERAEPGSPLGALAHRLEGATLPELSRAESDPLANQMGALPLPGPESDISREEWRTALTIVGDFLHRFPTHDSPRPQTVNQEPIRTHEFHKRLALGIRPLENQPALILVDWGMVASSPKEVARLIGSIAGHLNNTFEVAFLNTEGEANLMREQLHGAGLGEWVKATILDRKALQEASALLEGGRVDLNRLERYIHDKLHRQGLSPGHITQVVADPLNARRYIGDVVRVLMDVEEIVLQGDAAVALVTTLGHDATHPIKTPTLSYDPLTRTLRLPPSSLSHGALTQFDKVLLLVDTQA
jgi:ATP-dependent Lon protease